MKNIKADLRKALENYLKEEYIITSRDVLCTLSGSMYEHPEIRELIKKLLEKCRKGDYPNIYKD